MHQTSLTLHIPYSENPQIIIERSPNSSMNSNSSGGGGGGGGGGHKSPFNPQYSHSPLIIEPTSPATPFPSPKYHYFHKSPDIVSATNAAANFVNHMIIPHHTEDDYIDRQELEDYLEDEYVRLRPCLRMPTLLKLPSSFKNKKKNPSMNSATNRNKRVLTVSTSPKLSIVVPPIRGNSSNVQF